MNNLEHEIAKLDKKLQALATLRQQRQEKIESYSQHVVNATVTHQLSPSPFLTEYPG